MYKKRVNNNECVIKLFYIYFLSPCFLFVNQDGNHNHLTSNLHQRISDLHLIDTHINM